jgi:pheromone shutdown-related protein TraB
MTAAEELGNVTVIRRPMAGRPDQERLVHLIGTAHVSRKSVEEVRRVIAEVKPDTVCVELDQMRYAALTDGRWRTLDMRQIIRDDQMLFVMASLALQAFQKRLGKKLGVRPGAELLAAVEAAREIGAEVVLADREVQITLRRTWATIGLVNKARLSLFLMAAMFFNVDIDEEQVEQLKNREHMADAIGEFARHVPEVKQPLIDERDAFMISKIDEAPGDVIVAVVGASHVVGMIARDAGQVDRAALCRVPQPSPAARLTKWVLPLVMAAVFYWGYREQQLEGLTRMLLAWCIANAALASSCTLLSGGKLLSVLIAAVTAPITALVPVTRVGPLVASVEARLRRPTADDCERLGQDVTTWRDMHKNPFSRVLMVAVAASFGATLGRWVGAAWVLASL